MIVAVCRIALSPQQWAQFVEIDALDSVWEGVRGRGWAIRLVWPVEANSTLLVQGSVDDAASIGSFLRDVLQIFRGEFVEVHAWNLELTPEGPDRLRAQASFPPPGARCPGCGRGKPPHAPGCRFS